MALHAMNLSAKFVTFVPPIALAAIMFDLRHEPWDAMRWAGLVLFVVGLTFLTIARINLGNSFSVAAEARQLVTRGIYSRIRHPVYVFSFLVVAGLILYLHLPIFLLALIPLAALQVWRARIEERVLRAAFGAAYEEYRQHTWF